MFSATMSHLLSVWFVNQSTPVLVGGLDTFVHSFVSTSPVYVPRFVQRTQHFSGESNPNYKRQIAELADAGTNYTAARYEIRRDSPAHRAWVYQNQFGYGYVNPGIFVPDVSTILEPSLDNLARARFYRKVGRKFNASTTLAELRKTINMIRRPALTLRKALNDYIDDAAKRRRDLVDTARHRRVKPAAVRRSYVGVASSTWLEFSLGWKPLLLDIDGYFADALGLIDKPKIIRISAQESGGAASPIVLPTGQNCGDYWTPMSGAGGYTVRTSVRYKGALHTVLHSDLSGVDRLFFPEQFIPTLWELIPYSWVIDYFTNIGDILESWATAQGLRYVYVSKTVRHQQTSMGRVRPLSAPGTTTGYAEGYTEVVCSKTSRTRVDSVPLPSLVLSAKLSSAQGLNLVALITAKKADADFSRALFR